MLKNGVRNTSRCFAQASRCNAHHSLPTIRYFTSLTTSSRLGGNQTRSYVLALAGIITVAGLYAGSRSRIYLDDSVDVNEEQRIDPDGGVSGAKGSKKSGESSKIDVREDLRVEGWRTDKANGKEKGYITMEEVARHDLAHDAWVVVEGKVFDVTEFHKYHPGGSQIIVANAGRDVTEIFKPIHPPKTLENNLPPESFKGLVDPTAAADSLKAYEAEQQRVEQARNALPPVETMLGLDELQDAAESFLSPRVINYYGASSLDGYSTAENRTAFRKCRLIPRVMRDVTTVRPQTTIFGVPSALPIYISPASNALLGHPEGELNIVRGASKTGIVQGVSAAASFPLDEILQEKAKMDQDTGTKMGMVYQVYLSRDRRKNVEQLKEVVDGGVQALILTVDSNVGDHRQSTEKLKGARGDAQPGVRMGPIANSDQWHDASQNWDDLKFIREYAPGLPIYLKGVSHIEDVRLAKKHGLAGCILSNHGGRQLDGARTGFDSLRSIYVQDPQLIKNLEIYIDGGCRRGHEVLQALAFGAKGVGLGRPFLYAQAAYGEKGVIRAVRIMEKEIATAMQLMGVTELSQLKPDMVECLQEIWK
ncbi:hypothetical protein L486_00474 [Kwoniella mangroviensis CBS 10435]|uniref:L-mandelate dehydrogenase n=1 Tax=Kwoniella mangroviensis CBS 10435 TaxID=1331196 RepID=A0A1B9IZJ7_9TREE|nr:hypothetical protein L486_00474 [Kwoniella mangroviensis CBS 10435]